MNAGGRGAAVARALAWALGWLLVLLVATPARADGTLGFAVERHELPSRLCVDERTRVALTLRNDGALPWSAALGDRLAYHWLDADGREVVREGRRTRIVGVVLPGATAQLQARVDAPADPGRYTLVWAMVRDRVRWFPDPSGAIGHARVAVEVVAGAPSLGFSIVDADPIAAPAGERARTRVVVRNDGCATLSAAFGDALAYHVYDGDGRELVHEGVRTPLPALPAGAQVELSAEVELPPFTGAAWLVWEPVREEVAWFGAPRQGDARTELVADAPALAWSLQRELPAELGGFAGAAASIEVVVRNDGERTWSSADGDALSYRLFDAEQRPLSIEGVRTPLPHTVEPGELVQLSLRVELPGTAGRYHLRVQPVREHVRWYGPAADDPEGWGDTVRLEVGPPQFAWSIEAIAWPTRAWAGRSTTVRAVLRNDGADTWSPAQGDRVAYRFVDGDGVLAPGEAMRTELPHAVAPGESLAVDVRVRAPDRPGPWQLELAMVREHVAWYPPPQQRPPAVRTIVLRRGLVACTVALALLVIAGLLVRRSASEHWLVGLLAVGWAPLHLAVGAGLIGELFDDLAGIEPWAGTETIAWSGAVLWALPLPLLPSRWRRRVAAGVLVFACALALVDLGYLDFFGSIVPSSALVALHHLGDAHATVFSLWHDAYLQLLTPLLLLVSLFALAPPQRERAGLRVIYGALALAAAWPAIAALRELADSPIGARVFSERDNVGRFGLWNAHAFELSRTLSRWLGVDALAPGERRELAQWLHARTDARPRPSGSARGANLVVIQVEAMQAWVLDAEIGGEPVMPFAHGADRTARVFTHVFDQTAQGRTSDAEYAVLQSSHPLRAGSLAFLRADNRFDTLAHRLLDAGYTTSSAHPYARGFWNRATIHPRYGFQHSWFREELGDGPLVGWGLSDVAFLERMGVAYGREPQPFFGFLVTLSLHHPYDDFPIALAELDTGSLSSPALANYLQGMRHADRALARFFEVLRAEGLADHTVVIVYGDHVAGLPDSPELRALEGATAWDPTVPTRMHRVPALVFAPGLAPGRDDRIGGHIDLAPTALDLLGIAPAPTMLGRSLLAPAEARVVALPDGSAIADDRLWLARGRDDISGGGCFDRDGRARPREDCDGLVRDAAAELWAARAVLDHDLHRAPAP